MKLKQYLALALLSGGGFLSSNVSADILDLVDQFSSPLEQDAARAVYQTYQDLKANAGCLDTMLVDPASQGTGVPIACTGQTFQLFNNVRRLMHTANEISNDRNNGIAFSLGLDLRGLGLALRWNAVEEYNAQASLSSDFLQGQLAGLGTRISALRFGAQANQFAGIDPYLIYQTSATGGAAGEESYSPWGGFVHYSGGSGKKAPTSLEDAFDVESEDVTLGGDYKINPNWVVGLVVGVTDSEIDFDSAKSIVDGGVISEGVSVMPFVMYQEDNWFASLALGYQAMSFDTKRSVRYPSLNPDVPSPNTQTISNTDSVNISLSGELGYNYQLAGFSAEPFLKFDYVDSQIDGFVEQDLNDKAFDVTVASQSFDSLESSLGLRLRYTFSTPMGVITPFVSVQAISQSNTDARQLSARYTHAASSVNAFQLSSDELDKQYLINSYGIASVIRGGRDSGDGQIAGGLQVFFQYKEIVDLQNYEYAYYTAGLRYEF